MTSANSEAARAYEQTLLMRSPSPHSIDSASKQDKIQKRWDAVLDRKNANVENKQAHLHELLMKKLKKEKKLKQRLED